MSANASTRGRGQRGNVSRGSEPGDAGVRITLRDLASGGREGPPQPFEGLCRFRNELIHEDGMDLLGIRGSVPPRPWRVVPRLDFLFPPPRTISPSLCRSSSAFLLAGWRGRKRDGEAERSTVPGPAIEEERGTGRKGTRRHWHSPGCPPYTYSDCRFKCLLITRLVPQPPRSRSLCIFISTSSGRFRERGRFIFICRRQPTVPLRLAGSTAAYCLLPSGYACAPRLAGQRHNDSRLPLRARFGERSETAPVVAGAETLHWVL